MAQNWLSEQINIEGFPVYFPLTEKLFVEFILFLKWKIHIKIQLKEILTQFYGSKTLMKI